MKNLWKSSKYFNKSSDKNDDEDEDVLNFALFFQCSPASSSFFENISLEQQANFLFNNQIPKRRNKKRRGEEKSKKENLQWITTKA